MTRGRPPKLSDDEVREIRNSRLTVTELAGLYKISKAQVSRIRSGSSR
jgi:predicted FMN-binding regulatory protein PaiB